jgi:hypothetical protein
MIPILIPGISYLVRIDSAHFNVAFDSSWLEAELLEDMKRGKAAKVAPAMMIFSHWYIFELVVDVS